MTQSEVQPPSTILESTRDTARADRTRAIDRRGIWAGRLIGGAIAAIGSVLAAGGLWLILLGGSLYYLMSGIGYVVVGVLLWRRRPAGAWLAVALFAAAVVWALWEAGLNYWALFPRVLLPASLAFIALLVTLRFPANKSWRVAAHTAGVLWLLIGVQFAFAFVPHGAVYSPPSRPFLSAEHSNEPSDWYSYGRTNAGTRYSPFTQINRENVSAAETRLDLSLGRRRPGHGAEHAAADRRPRLHLLAQRSSRCARCRHGHSALALRRRDRTCLLVPLPRSRLLRAAGRAARGGAPP